MSFPAAGPEGMTETLTREVVRRDALGVGPVGRRDAEVAVLDARMEANAVAPTSERSVERGHDRADSARS